MLCKMMPFVFLSGTGVPGHEFEGKGLDFSAFDVSTGGVWF